MNSASISLYGPIGSGSGSSNGTSYFGTDGSPMLSPSFSVGGQTFTNLPNQNDRYEITAGAVTALKYDLSNPSNYSLQLSLTGRTYEFGFGGSPTESGIYQITHQGGNSYSLVGTQTGSTLTGTFQMPYTAPGGSGGTSALLAQMSNLPNQNDDYLVSGGQVTAMKFDLNGSSYSVRLSLNGCLSLFVFVRCLFVVVCCLSFVVCCILSVVRRLLFVCCLSLGVVCFFCRLFVVFCLLFVYCLLFVVCLWVFVVICCLSFCVRCRLLFTVCFCFVVVVVCRLLLWSFVVVVIVVVVLVVCYSCCLSLSLLLLLFVLVCCRLFFVLVLS